MSTPPDVIFVVVDTVRRDRVSAYGYERETTPNFDTFASDATVFTDAVAQAPWSVPAHASLFTGTYPFEHGATTVRPIFRSKKPIAVRLRAAGYETYAVSPNEYVRPLNGFGRGFEEFHTLSRPQFPAQVADISWPFVHTFTGTRIRLPFEYLFNAKRRREPRTTGFEGHNEDSLVDTVADILSRASSPYFLFVNLFDCHLPRTPAMEHAERFVDDDLRDQEVVSNERAHMLDGRSLTDRERRKMSQLYDADLRTTDDRLGELLTLLKDHDGLVVILSDHGEHLGEFDLLGHQFSVFDPVVSVPMAIQFPDGGPERVDAQVETRRVFHTILDETGMESFPDASLRSGIEDDIAYGQFVSPMVDIGRHLWHREWTYDTSLLGEPLSFVRNSGTKLVEFAGEEWLFNLPEVTNRSVSRMDGHRLYNQLSNASRNLR